MTTTTPKKTRAAEWEQVGKRFDTLGTDLRRHFDGVGADAAAEREAFEKALRGLLTAVQGSFSATGAAVRDVTLRRDIAELADALGDAFRASLESTGEQVRARLTPRTGKASRQLPSTPKAERAVPRKAAARKPTKPASASVRPHRSGPRSGT